LLGLLGAISNRQALIIIAIRQLKGNSPKSQTPTVATLPQPAVHAEIGVTLSIHTI